MGCICVCVLSLLGGCHVKKQANREFGLMARNIVSTKKVLHSDLIVCRFDLHNRLCFLEIQMECNDPSHLRFIATRKYRIPE